LFTINDVTVSGGSFGALTHVGVNGAGQDIYTATFTPTAGNAVAGSVQIGPGTYIDASANAGAASNTLSIASDTLAPTVSVTADPNTLQAGQTSTVTFTRSEAVSGFTLDDVTMSGGTFGVLNHVGMVGAQDVYTVVFTPDTGNALAGSVQVDAASY